jgi:hypothetical protein
MREIMDANPGMTEQDAAAMAKAEMQKGGK